MRQRIIDTALVLFEQHGFHGVSVNRIIENAGTSKGGFYHHFQTKDELLYVIHNTFITYVLEQAAKAKETFESPAQKLQLIIREFVKVFDLYKSHIAVFYQEAIYLKSDYESLIKKKRDQFKQIIIQIIREGKECGEFRKDIQVEVTSMAVLGMVNWIYKWYNRNGSRTIDDIGDIFVDLILRSLLPLKALTLSL